MRITLMFLLSWGFLQNVKAQPIRSLSAKQKGIVAISALTAKGNLPGLKIALNEGFDAGITVNEIKEIMIQLYAYCGFPRALNGINTVIVVLEERKANGIRDAEGVAPNEVSATDKYRFGKKTLDNLTGSVVNGPPKGYAAFVPAIDTMLKEHLFADVFGRGVLTNQERELTTVSALVSVGGVESQLSGHLGIAIHNGLTKEQLHEMFAIHEQKIGKNEADTGRAVLNEVLTKQ